MSVKYMPMDMRGDGRCKIHPSPNIGIDHIGLCKPVRLATARIMVNLFLKHGESRHSGSGSTMWVIQEFCHRHLLPYRAHLEREGGYIKLGQFQK